MKNKKIGISPYDLLVKLICIYGWVSFLYIFVNKFYASYIVGLLVILIMGFIYIKTLRFKDIGLIIFLVFLFIYTLLISGFSSNDLQHGMYFSFTLLIINKLIEPRFRLKMVSAFKKNKKFVLLTIILLSCVSLISFFVPSSYSGYVYKGFAANFHSVGINMTYLALLIIIYLYKKEFKLFYLLWFLIPLIGVLESTARVSLVTIILTLYIYYQLKLEKMKVKYLLIPVGFFGIYKFFMDSSAYEKFLLAANNQYISSNKLEAVTSGRLIWWDIDLNAYSELGLFYQIFGAGHDFVYFINKSQYGLDIWAHNDFIQLLLATGIIGLLGYLGIIGNLYIEMSRNRKQTHVRFMPEIIFVFIVFIAMFNGFYLGTQNNICLILMMVIACYDIERREEWE